MTRPKDQALYDRIKAQVYREMPKHSAYRSATLVRRYKAAGGEYEGPKPTATGPKASGIGRWMNEEWTNQRGGIGYRRRVTFTGPASG